LRLSGLTSIWARTELGVVSMFADDAAGKEFKAMVNMINSLKVKPKDDE
jgi:hypothetical protein